MTFGNFVRNFVWESRVPGGSESSREYQGGSGGPQGAPGSFREFWWFQAVQRGFQQVPEALKGSRGFQGATDNFRELQDVPGA